MQATQKDVFLQKACLWQRITQDADDTLSFDQLKDIYQAIFRNDPLGIAWLPSEETIEGANITRLMQRFQLDSYPDLYAWSVAHRSLFWEEAIQSLEIHFDQPYRQVLDTTIGGAENPEWLPGARFNIVKSCFRAEGSKTAIIASDENEQMREISYTALQSLCNRFSNGLLKQGLQAGDRIVLYIPLCPEAVAAYLGIIQAGMVAVLVADSFSQAELQKRLKSSDARAIVTLDEYTYGSKRLNIYQKIQDAEAPMAIVVSGRDSPKLRSQDVLWDDFLDNEGFESVSATPDSLISILYSSGTTSEPKAIPWTQLTPIKCGTDAHFHHDVQPDDIITWTTGMGWMMGPWTIFAALMNRATLALFTGSAAGKAFGNFTEKSEITILGTIPSLVKAWKNTAAMEAFDWKVRLFSSTGEPSQVDDYLYLMWLCHFRAPIIEYCGGTEIGGGYMTGSLLQPASPATFTTPALGMELRFRNEESGKLLPDQDGEVFIVPPSIGLSQKLLNRDHHEEYYAGTPRLEDGTPLRRHGDDYQIFAEPLDDIRFFKSRGRADDSMNLGGIKISAVEIEKIINQHQAVYESAAVAIAPEAGGPEALVVFFVSGLVKPDLAELKAEWQQMIARELNPLFRIKDVIARKDLPRTASNKLMRRLLRKEYSAHY